MDNMVRDYYIDPIAANETLASLVFFSFISDQSD